MAFLEIPLGDRPRDREADLQAALRHLSLVRDRFDLWFDCFARYGKKVGRHFVGEWVPTLLILGVYNKLVKLHGSERRF